MDFNAGKEHEERPLAANPAIAPATPDRRFGGYVADEEASAAAASGWRSAQFLRKRRCLLCCCGCCSTTVILLGITILVLALTVFKAKDPEITIGAVRLSGLDAGVRGLGFDAGAEGPVTANATLTAVVSIRNPNVASFSYDNCTTEFYYDAGGETGTVTVAEAYAPAGSVGAGKTETMNVTTEVLLDQLNRANVPLHLFSDTMVNLTSFTAINGRINIWGIYKHDLLVALNCSMTLNTSLFSQQLQNKVCVTNVS